MIYSNSSLIKVNITAGTVILSYNNYTSPHDMADNFWWIGDTLYVNGNLTMDNGTGLANMKVNVTITWNDDTLVNNTAFTTDIYGGFNATFAIGLVPEWPDFVSDTKIIVYFNPTYNNEYFLEQSETQFN